MRLGLEGRVRVRVRVRVENELKGRVRVRVGTERRGVASRQKGILPPSLISEKGMSRSGFEPLTPGLKSSLLPQSHLGTLLNSSPRSYSISDSDHRWKK